MKRLSVLFIVPFVFLFAGCPSNVNSKFEPNLKSIKNFSNYSSLGVASKDIGASRSARSAEDNSADVLVGLNKYTEAIEELTYETSDETEEKEELFVYSYTDTTPFLFVQFSRESMESNGSFVNISGLEETDFSPIYAISKKSGKIYSLEDIWFDNFQGFGDAGNQENTLTYSDSLVFVGVCNLDSDFNSENDRFIYSLTEENELLKIEKYCRWERLNGRYIVSDIYGNLASSVVYNNIYYLTPTKELKQNSSFCCWFKGYDGKLYSESGIDIRINQDELDELFRIDYSVPDDLTEYSLSKEGDIITVDYLLLNYFIFPDDCLLYSDGLDYYYYVDRDTPKRTNTDWYNYGDGRVKTDFIYKITFKDESKSQFSESIDHYVPNAIKIGFKFFYLKNSSTIICYNFLDHSEVTLSPADCTITKIEKSGNNIYYKGYASDNISDIDGFIDADTLEIISAPKLRKAKTLTAIYLTPLN